MAPQGTIVLSVTLDILVCLERVIMIVDPFKLYGITIMDQQEKIKSLMAPIIPKLWLMTQLFHSSIHVVMDDDGA